MGVCAGKESPPEHINMGAGASKKTAGGGSPKGGSSAASTIPPPVTAAAAGGVSNNSGGGTAPTNGNGDTNDSAKPATSGTTAAAAATSSTSTGLSLRVGSSCVQGHRPYQEDRVSIHHPLVMPDGKVDHSLSFFGVFDGHGGSWAAEYAVKRLHAFVAKEKDLLPTDTTTGPVPIELAILRAFHDFDKELSLQSDEGAHSTGTTAAVALIDKDYIYVGNAGDSRCVLCNNFQAQCLTIDHKPTDAPELERIEAAGGRVPNRYVELEDRGLAVSRALGDLFFKRNKSVGVEQQVVISTPHLQRIPRRSDDQFLLLASDGLWNVMSDQQACDFVLRSRQAPAPAALGLAGDGIDPNSIGSLGPGLSAHISAAFMESMDDSCSRLTQRALDLRSKDNISVLVIELNGALSPAAPLPNKPKPSVTPLSDDSIARAAAAGEIPADAVNSINGNMSRRQHAATAQASLMKTLALQAATEKAAAASAAASSSSSTPTSSGSEVKYEPKAALPSTPSASTASESSQPTIPVTATSAASGVAVVATATPTSVTYEASVNSSPVTATIGGAMTPSIAPVLVDDSGISAANVNDVSMPLPGAALTATDPVATAATTST